MHTKGGAWILSILPIVFISVIIHSCFKDDIDLQNISNRIELKPGIALPIGYGTLTIDDLLQRFDSGSFITIDSATGLLRMVYNTELVSLKASDLATIPNQFFEQFFIRSEISSPIMPDSIVLSKSKNYIITLNQGEKIDSIVLKSALLQYNISSSFLHTGILEISSSALHKNGKPYKDNIMISSASGNFSDQITRNLAGYTMKINRSSNEDTSFIPLNFKLTLYNSGGALRSNDSVQVDIFFQDLNFKIIYGDLGYKSYLYHEGILPISIFSNAPGGSIEFAEPKMDIAISNSYGVPIQLAFPVFRSESDEHGNTNITFPPSENPILINYPLLSEMGQRKNTEISFNNISPSISEVISDHPSRLAFIASAYTDTSLSGGGNFVMDTSIFTARLNVELPLWLRAGGFELKDTIEFNFSEMVDNPNYLDTLDLKLDISNGLPIDLGIQLTITDEFYNVLDVIFDPTTLPQVKSGILDAQFRVNQSTGKTSHSTMASLGQSKVQHIKNARWAIITASLTTTDYNTNPGLKVKFYSDYGLDFKISAKARMRIEQSSNKNK